MNASLLAARRRVAWLAVVGCCCGLSGCLVTTAIGVAAETVEAGVGITGAAVGATAGAVVDVVDGDDDEPSGKD
ncbi:MAG: hypothetical protein AAF648_07010 [Pseudomonadota bacterium]